MSERFYFHLNGRRVGPLEFSLLKKMAQGGELAPETPLETEDGRQFRADKIFPAIFDEPSEDALAMIDIVAVDPFDVSRGDTEETLFGYSDASNPWKYDGKTSSSVWPSPRKKSEGRKREAHGSAASSELFYFYDKRDCRWGPVSAVDLKLLAREKRIDENTFIEASDGTLRRATDIRELAVIIQTNAKKKAEKLAGSQIFFIVFLCVLGAIVAIGGIVWALTHLALCGRLLLYGALAILTLGAAWYVGKAAWKRLEGHWATIGVWSAILLFFVVLWKCLGGWLFLILLVFVLAIIGASNN